ncbi:MAG: FtsX-like permease family protein [Ruminococcus sp.]|uniref:ABC transporter permease n=1 Tax=Ruminococcus sp. TaxID=41978 RepID=UPI0025D36ACB|nr:FtsX-like permease family protein [Ruminococcus sp.]MCR5599614.1 FtsX-like permease family protein [Ruminococcus sp.]
MRLILKHTFKNILAHKLRTLLLLICITVCSFTAMMCLDMSGSLKIIIRGMFTSFAGDADMQVRTKSPIGDDFADGAPDCTVLKISGVSCYFDRHLDIDLSYVRRENMDVIGLEPDIASEMHLVRDGIEIGGKKVAITKQFSKEFGYEVGDKIILHGERDIPVEFTVGCVEKKQGFFDTSTNMVISMEDLKELILADEPECDQAFIDVHDDSRITEAEKFFKKKYPSADVNNFMESKEMREQIQSITNLFFVLFALCMLLVVFVTISVSERMIIEKMSVVGTFRSLGISSKLTTTAMLMENALYGLIGGIIGVVLYAFVKEPFFYSVFTFSANGDDNIKPDIPSASVTVMLIVVACAILIECLCPIKEVVKAVKTSIRDIIFDTKDTEYRPSRTATVLGIILFAVSAVTFFFKDSFVMNMICFVTFFGALSLLFNYVHRFIARLLEKLFEKLNFPIAHLAAVEAGAKKCTVGSSVLCVTAASVAMVIYIFANSLSMLYSYPVYKTDVIASLNDVQMKYLSYVEQIDGVDDVEFIYIRSNKVKLNGKKVDIIAYGWKDGGYDMFNAFDGVPDTIADDEVVLDKFLMKKYGIKTGDEVEIVFNCEGYMPIEKKLKVAGRIENDYNAASGISLVISENSYKSLFNDQPTDLLVSGSNPEALKKSITDHSGDYVYDVKTIDEYNADMKQERASLTAIITMLIIIGVGLTFIGIVSNQLIGLEGRKRECAVMTSVAMPRKKLSRMFLLENFFASAISLAVSLPTAFFMSKVFLRIMEALQIYVPLDIEAGRCAGCAALLCLIFTLVSLFPIRALKKMDIVTQLKYE